MSDPFAPLEGVDLSEGTTPMPAAQVRARGDRLRRRRHLLQGAAATLALLTVVGGGVALGDGVTGDAAPPPAPVTQGPSPDRESTAPGPVPVVARQPTTVPADFPLGALLPAADGDTTTREHDALDRPRSFDPCHDNERAADPDRTDLAQIEQSGPARTHLREIAVYRDSSAADRAMTLAHRELERCAAYRYEDGVSRDDWEPMRVPDGRLVADDAIAYVNHAFTDGVGRMTLADTWIVARTGNAVLTLVYSGEFGMSPDGVDQVTARDLKAYEAIAPHMCAFADETSVGGCTGTAPGPGEITDPGPTFLLDEAALRAASGDDGFETVADTTAATLACQGDWLASLDPETADYREFESRTDSGDLASFAGTAVLGFADEAAARAAYRTVTEDWLADCDPQVDPTHRLVTVVGDGLGAPHTGSTGTEERSWRGVKLSAPETCVECDAAWEDGQGAALVGTRLVLVHVAVGGDMQLDVDDSRNPMDDVLAAAAERARTR